jgi:hypothetical protein
MSVLVCCAVVRPHRTHVHTRVLMQLHSFYCCPTGQSYRKLQEKQDAGM